MLGNNKNKRPKDSTEWAIVTFAKTVFSLELMTVPGRINAAFGFLLVILAVALTVRDWITKIILSAVSAFKTWILGTNIIETYETADTTLLVILTIVFFAFCVSILIVWDNNQKKVSKKLMEVNKKK